MFNSKLKQKIKMLEEELQASKEDHKAHQLIIDSYRKDVKELKRELEASENEIYELKSKIARKEQPRGSDGRFAKKDSTPFKPQDGDIIAVDTDNARFKTSVLVGILRGKLETGNEWLPVYAGLDLNENLRIEGAFRCHHEARPATKKEKEKLFSALKKEGLKWNAGTKTLDKIGREFKVGDKVKIVDGFNPEEHRKIKRGYPLFTEEMDSVIDKIGVVAEISKVHKNRIRVDFGSLYYYHPDWLEHVES